MALVTIPPQPGDPDDPEAQARAWCRRLEAGDILYFPQTPIHIRPQDLSFLLGQQQTGSKLHKNIAYKPSLDRVSGLDAGTAGAEELKQLQAVMRKYSQDVTRFLTGFLSPYKGRWQLDYASFRPQEELGRDLPLRRRNDLLHTDAFPTRPTRGARILRFFNNINPAAFARLGSQRPLSGARAHVCAATDTAACARQLRRPRAAFPGQHCRPRICDPKSEAVAL